jgi:carbon monoxide dehydrogenase subunit G
MASITKSVFIAAPVEKVFAFMDEPMNTVGMMVGMIDVRNIKDKNGSKSFDWTYKMGGMKFDGSSETIERIPNQKLTMAGKGGIESTFVWTFAPENGGTRATVHIDYKVPIPVLGKLAEGVITRQNEKDTETMMTNLKAKVEAQEMVKS